MSEEKYSEPCNTHITSDSHISPIKTTQKGMQSSDRSENQKKDTSQNSPVIDFGPIDDSRASVSLIKNINYSSLESNLSSTLFVSTDMQRDGSCVSVFPATTATIKDSIQNGDCDTLESKNDCYMISKELCDNSKKNLSGDKTVAETMSSDSTEDLLEDEILMEHKGKVEPLRKDATNISDIFDSKIIENGKESGKNKVIAEIPLVQVEPYAEDVVDTQENIKSLLLTKERLDEDEAMEILLTSRVDGDDGKNVFTKPNVNQTRDILSACSQPHGGSSCGSLKSTNQHFLSSNTSEKIVGDIKDNPGSPAVAPQPQGLATQSLHKQSVISSSVPCILKDQSQSLHKQSVISSSVPCIMKDQSQVKADVTASLSTMEDSHKQNLTKNISIENQIDKKHNKDIKDLIKDKMTKADKKNEKLKVGENYSRINYLVQASRKIFKKDKSVSSQLGSLAISFGRRLPQVRLDPLLKREMCKGCGVYLVYGVNAKVRHRSKRQKHLVVTCMTCHTIKRFVTNPNHKLWSEQPEAQVK